MNSMEKKLEAVHIDVSEADKKDGIKYTSVYAGDRKNDLSPHEPISNDAMSDLQMEVNRLYELFVDVVSSNRGIQRDAIRRTEAKTYFGKNAIDVGLADEIVTEPMSSFAGRIGKKPVGLVVKEEKKMTEKEADGAPIAASSDGTAEAAHDYRAETVEIAQLCRLAHAENRLAEFIEHGLSVAQVKETLLEAASTNTEIASAVCHEMEENPVIAAAKQRVVASKNALR